MRVHKTIWGKFWHERPQPQTYRFPLMRACYIEKLALSPAAVEELAHQILWGKFWGRVEARKRFKKMIKDGAYERRINPGSLEQGGGASSESGLPG